MGSLSNDDRVELRLSCEAKAAIEVAAALSGQSLGDFAVSTLLEKANLLLGSHRIRSLTCKQNNPGFQYGNRRNQQILGTRASPCESANYPAHSRWLR